MVKKKPIFEDQLIVITGAAGMIGSAVVRALNERGYSHLILVDDLGSSTKWLNVRSKQFVELMHKEELFPYLEGRERQIGAFIHMGACSDTTETDANYLLQNNTRYSMRLAEYALKHGHRFIYASSAATYGAGELGFSDDHDLLLQLKPLNMYGYSKHLFDLWLQRQGALSAVVGLKFFNVFGPNENEKGRMASMIFKAVPEVLKEGVIRLFRSSEPNLYPDGGQSRDFIYVKDVAEMVCAFLENGAGGIYNVGQGIATTWNEVAQAIFAALEMPERIEYIEMPQDLIGRYQNFTCAKVQKLANLFKGEPKRPLCKYTVKEGVRDYVQEYILKGERW